MKLGVNMYKFMFLFFSLDIDFHFWVGVLFVFSCEYSFLDLKKSSSITLYHCIPHLLQSRPSPSKKILTYSRKLFRRSIIIIIIQVYCPYEI
jgi:hypothetical protein